LFLGGLQPLGKGLLSPACPPGLEANGFTPSRCLGEWAGAWVGRVNCPDHSWGWRVSFLVHSRAGTGGVLCGNWPLLSHFLLMAFRTAFSRGIGFFI
jgi:hypothetical protein